MNSYLKYSIIFLGGILVGMLLGFLTLKPMRNFYGAEPSLKEKELHHKLDSLSNLQIKSDTVIVKINNTKTKIKYEYIKDTIYLTKLSFDSIKVLFSKEYPRHPDNK